MYIDITPYGFIITAAVVSYGLLKFKLLHIVPIAREKIIEAMQEGVLVLDQDNKIVDFNAQLIELLSLNEPELIRANMADILPAQEKLHQLAKNRIGMSIELDMYTSGSCRYLEVNSRVLSGKNKAYRGLLLLFRDITEHKKAQQRASSAYHLFTGVLDSSLSAVMAFRAIREAEQNVVDFECIACSQKAITIVSPHANALIGNRLI
jgi:PAS domain S-box-containing protein